jgi:DNA-binding MarR family transcriptional regulator
MTSELQRVVEEKAPEDVFVAVEHELTVLLRRARGTSKEFARQIHPELESDAYGLLIRLAEVGGARGTDLAAFFGIGKPTISRQVKMLEELGLVERQSQEGDARASVLVLTEDGQRRMARMRDARQARFRQLLTGWDTADVEQFAGLLHRWNAMLEAPRSNGAQP